MSFGFFTSTKKIGSSGLLQGYADHHCHLLPGVDDGVQEQSETLALLQMMQDQGVKDVWLTPHVMQEMPNLPGNLQAGFTQLETAASSFDHPHLHLAAENMLDAGFLLENACQHILPGNHILVETSYFTPPFNMKSVLNDILKAGYYPLLAHPCRYEYMTERDYEQLHDMNVHFQLNLPVLTGMYGPVVEKKAFWLLDHGYYLCSGTDTHNQVNYQRFLDSRLSSKRIKQLQNFLYNI